MTLKVELVLYHKENFALRFALKVRLRELGSGLKTLFREGGWYHLTQKGVKARKKAMAKTTPENNDLIG